MNETQILQALVGWRCPCCRTVHAPTVSICMHCSPFMRIVGQALGDQIDPRMFHDCPAPQHKAARSPKAPC